MFSRKSSYLEWAEASKILLSLGILIPAEVLGDIADLQLQCNGRIFVTTLAWFGMEQMYVSLLDAVQEA